MDNKIHALQVTKVIQSSSMMRFDTLVFSNGVILDVGFRTELEKIYSFDTFEQIDKALILPGFINTHTHSIQTFFRGLAENMQLLDWLNKVILPGEAALTKEQVYASSLLGFVDMVSHGTTFANDMITTHHSEQAIQAAIDIGIRTKIGKTLMDIGPDELVDDTTQAIEDSHQLINQYHHKNPLIEYSINPRFLVSCSPALMKACSSFLQEDPTLSFHTHASENKSEIQTVKSIHGDYVSSLQKYGNLSNRSILAHGIWLDEDDIKVISSTNTAIAHCPSSNAKLASGICNWPNLQENGIHVGLGTDGPPSNNSMDMFREMRMATFVQRLRSLNEVIAPATKVFDLATIEGAKALRRDDLGILEKGKKADFIVIDISQPHHYPLHNYINHLVFKSSGEDALRTYINGLLVYDKLQEDYDKKFPQTPAQNIAKVLNISSKYVENTSLH